jgi:hypothetical protein
MERIVLLCTRPNCAEVRFNIFVEADHLPLTKIHPQRLDERTAEFAALSVWCLGEGHLLLWVSHFFLHPPRLLRLLRVERCEVLHQQPVDEDIATTDFTEENALGAIVQEGDEAEREVALAIEHPA